MARRKRYCKPFSKAALDRGAKIERREHGLSLAMARKIARDHLCAKGDRAYPADFSGLKRRGFKVPGWHHARGMPEIALPRTPKCECKCEKGIHYGRGHSGECMTIGCRCQGYRPMKATRKS